METLPLGALYDTDNSNDKPTHISCSTPATHNSGAGSLAISANGQDYTGSMGYEFNTALELYKLQPQCGPLDGNTNVKLIGSGFDAQKNSVFSKFGVLATQQLDEAAVKIEAWDLQSYLNP